MIIKILIIFLIIVVCLILNIKLRRGNHPVGDITTNSIVINIPTSAIFSSISIIRPANVPLIPFKSPLKINKINELIGVPTFVLYKTEYLSEVVDQGSCGSCWAFAITNMLSDRISTSTGGDFKLNLSAQQILECFDPESGCKGNSPEEALKWLEKSGYKITTNDVHVYKQFDNLKIKGLCPISTAGVSVKKGSIRSLTKWIEEKDPNKTYLEENVKNMKLELINNGPFFAAMSVYPDLYTYNGLGVYEHDKTASIIGGHAIEIIGFCNPGVDTRDALINSKLGYWICRNSWSSNWPVNSHNKGFFIVRMGTNESGIESRSGLADINVSKGVDNLYTKFNDYKSFIDILPNDKKLLYVDAD
jgi:cathepsin B